MLDCLVHFEWRNFWISGPWNFGGWKDLEIFSVSLASQLDQFERIEADDGYIGKASLKVKCPTCIMIPENKKAMMNRVRSRQETNKKLYKQWGILSQHFHHDIRVHHDVCCHFCSLQKMHYI